MFFLYIRYQRLNRFIQSSYAYYVAFQLHAVDKVVICMYIQKVNTVTDCSACCIRNNKNVPYLKSNKHVLNIFDCICCFL